jgi:DNA-binding FadR family transcriptional regulator
MGYGSDSRKIPSHIAWVIEKDAVEQGWTAGLFIGSERELIERFDVSRDVVREAIRLLEARGSIIIERGRNGGMRLAEPDLEWAAGAFAVFLRAFGYSDAQLNDALSIITPLLDDPHGDDLIIRLLNRTHELLGSQAAPNPRCMVLGFRIATRLIQHFSPIPAEGVRLGSEDSLCERFNTSRPTFRQALRILDDLGTLQVQRGRGGGYLLKRPSSIGVVRQMFALLASRQQSLRHFLPMKWTLDVVKLRLAIRSLQQLDANSRLERLQSLKTVLECTAEPTRWCMLQQSLSRIGKDPMVNTLVWCLVAYHVRVAPSTALWGAIETELHQAERAIVHAIGEGNQEETEYNLRRGQALISGYCNLD